MNIRYSEGGSSERERALNKSWKWLDGNDVRVYKARGRGGLCACFLDYYNDFYRNKCKKFSSSYVLVGLRY